MTPFQRSKRPIRVYFLAIFILWLAAWNGLRLGETIFFWRTLETYGAHPLYIAISGGIWVVSGLLIDWGFFLGKAWGWAATLAGTLVYPAWYWFDRLVLQEPHANWPFVLVVNIVLILIIYSILLSRKTRLFFKRDVYERNLQTPTIT